MANRPQPRSPLDTKAIELIKFRRKCDRDCPAFSLCPLMPLAIQPNNKAKVCLVNEGPEEIRRAYMHLFMEGADGVIEEMRTGILHYSKILKELRMTERERLKYLKEQNAMLSNLHKILQDRERRAGAGKKGGEEEEDDAVVILTGYEKEEEKKPEPVAVHPIIKQFFPEDD